MPGNRNRDIFHPRPPDPPRRAILPDAIPATAPAVDEPDADCGRCDAVCCRLTVVLQSTDHIPLHYTTWTSTGLHVMARDEEGWCVAVDGTRMQCSIYESRPQVCRRFVMAGPYCREVRADYSDRNARGIPLQLF